jgi:DNA-binding transcriptional LysR family regulator
MNLTQLRAFVAVVEHQSFSGAARALGLSQPAVTMQLQSLESEAGATLLDRRYRRIEPTEAGRALLPHAERILAEIAAARSELEHLGDRVTGRLDIAGSTTPGDYVIPPLLGGFLAAHPEVGVSLRVMDTAAVVEAVASGEARLGMTGAEIESGGKVTFESLGADELVMVCHPSDPLAGRRCVAFSDLVDEAFVMRRQGSGTRIVSEDAIRAGGIDPSDLRVVAELGTSEAIVRAVEGGLGIGIVSRWVAEKALKLGTVAEVDVRGFPVQRPFFMVKPKGPCTRAAEAFVEHLRQAL